MKPHKLPRQKDVVTIPLANHDIQVVTEVNYENREYLTQVALSMYTKEPCRICGVLITDQDLSELVFAGYSKHNQARAAHGVCWQTRGQDEPTTWSYP